MRTKSARLLTTAVAPAAVRLPCLPGLLAYPMLLVRELMAACMSVVESPMRTHSSDDAPSPVIACSMRCGLGLSRAGS